MSERLQGISAEEIRRCLAEEELRDWVQQQRWYASKSRAIAGIDIVESITLREDPLMLLALVQTRFATGTHELYQLPAGDRACRARCRAVRRSRTPTAGSSTTRWPSPSRRMSCCAGSRPTTRSRPPRAVSASIPSRDRRNLAETTNVRLMGVEQSNSSLVFDDRLVLKVFRKLEPGVNPELEVLRFLT